MHASPALPAPLAPGVPQAPIAPGTRSRLWLPRLSLAACLRAVMGRDTRGATLSTAQRFNHFPATPLCALSWWFEGDSEFLAPGAPPTLDAARAPLPDRVLFSGPQTGPITSWCPGPVHGLMALLMPDAVHELTGIEPGDFVNRFVPAREVLPPDWQRLVADVLADADDHPRVRRIEDFLDPRWQRARPRRSLAAHRYADWAQGLALRAAAGTPGRSLRQMERRIKQWAGLPLRELQVLSRAERAFFQGLAAGRAGNVPWADLAMQAGYADQSHLIRATRRVTGFSPEALRRGIEREEPFWPYRIWE